MRDRALPRRISVTHQKALNPHELVDAYFDLLDELRSVLGVEVDLVMVEAVKSRCIAADIERTKQVLYAA